MNATIARAAAWSLSIFVVAGLVLFGGVQPEHSFLLAGLLLVAGAAVLIGAAADDRPGRWWTLALLGLPVWLFLQTIPLPATLVGLLSPCTAAWIHELWRGPLHGCHGEALLGPPPSFFPLSVDPTSTRELLLLVSAAVVVFLAARACFPHRAQDRRRLVVLLAAFAGAEAAYGLVQRLSATPYVLWKPKLFFPDAASGTLVNRNHFAAVLYLGLGCTLALLAQRDRGRSSPGAPGRAAAERVTFALLAGLQVAGILASKSRAGLAACLLVVVSGGLMFIRSRRAVAWIGLAVVALASVPLLFLLAPDLTARWSQVQGEWSGVASRGAVLRLSPLMIRDFPVFGAGGATFEYAFERYRPREISGLYDFAHNDYLQMLIEAGLIGLVLSLAPVALYAADVLRDARRRSAAPHVEFVDGPPAGAGWRPTPIYVALGALALHEVVDFALQIPAILFMVALLAGAAAPPSRDRRSRRIWLVPVVLALILAGPAAAHSVARWPWIRDVASIPDLPGVREYRVETLATTWAKSEKKDYSLLCRALPELARVQALRPLSARASVYHAEYLSNVVAEHAVAPGAAAMLREEAARLTGIVRTLDPWNAWFRQQLIKVDLSLGNLDDAVADARVATEVDPEEAEDVVALFLDAGLPASALSSVVARSPQSLAIVLQTLVDRKDFATAGRLVPPDPTPDFALCRSAWLVRTVLNTAHKAPAEKFLLGCLAVPEVKQFAWARESVQGALAMEFIDRNQDDRASSWVAQMSPGARLPLELLLAERRKDWDAAARFARSLLEGAQPPDNPQAEAWLRFRLGRAYALTGRLHDAQRELERGRTLDSSVTNFDQLIGQLRLGINPFK